MGSESWTLSTKSIKNLEAAEMWFYRRILKIPWTAHTSNETVLQMMHQDRQLLRTIEERRKKFVGHVIRKGEVEELSLAGKLLGSRARGRQRKLFLQDFQMSPRELWDMARDRQF